MLRGAKLALVALCCLAPLVHAADRRQLDSLRQRIEHLHEKIAGGEESRAEVRDQLRESERAISAANRKLRELARKRDQAKGELARLSAQQQSVRAEIDLGKARLSRMLVARYMGGERSYLKLLVMGEDPNEVARDLQYYSYISRAQADFIRSLRADLGRLSAIEAQASEKTSELSAIEADQRTQRASLLGQRAERRKVLSRISVRLQAQRRQMRSLERDEKRLTRLIDRLTSARPAPRGTVRNERVPSKRQGERLAHLDFARLKGKLRLPVKGYIVNRFGARRSDGGPPWKGLFIRAPAGEDVRAVAPGRVVFADWLRGFGNLLIIDHGEDYLTSYGDNESVFKAVGDEVHTGDVIATVGATGGSPESGLYFELRHRGIPNDPLKWVSLK